MSLSLPPHVQEAVARAEAQQLSLRKGIFDMTMRYTESLSSGRRPNKDDMRGIVRNARYLALLVLEDQGAIYSADETMKTIDRELATKKRAYEDAQQTKPEILLPAS